MILKKIITMEVFDNSGQASNEALIVQRGNFSQGYYL